MHWNENGFAVAFFFLQLIREQEVECVAGDLWMLGRRIIKRALSGPGRAGVVGLQFEVARSVAGDFDIWITGDLRGPGGVDRNVCGQTCFTQRGADEGFDVIAGFVGALDEQAFLGGAFTGQGGGGENFLLQHDVRRVVGVEVEDVKMRRGFDHLFEGDLFFRAREFAERGDEVRVG